MKQQQKDGLFAALVICLISAFIGWLCGYDFDHRDLAVAMWVCVTLHAAIAAYTFHRL